MYRVRLQPLRSTWLICCVSVYWLEMVWLCCLVGCWSPVYKLSQGKCKRGFVWHLTVNTPLRRSAVARILEESHSFTCTPCVHLVAECTIPAFSFPAEADPYLVTLEGWKAEFVWLHTDINVRHRELNPDTVTHPVTHRARCRLTSWSRPMRYHYARPPSCSCTTLWCYLLICILWYDWYNK